MPDYIHTLISEWWNEIDYHTWIKISKFYTWLVYNPKLKHAGEIIRLAK